LAQTLPRHLPVLHLPSYEQACGSVALHYLSTTTSIFASHAYPRSGLKTVKVLLLQLAMCSGGNVLKGAN